MVAILTAPPEETITTLDVPLTIELAVGTVPLTILTLVNVTLPRVVTVFPRPTVVFPIVKPVLKLASKLVNGMLVVALPKINGTPAI